MDDGGLRGDIGWCRLGVGVGKGKGKRNLEIEALERSHVLLD